MTDFEEAVRWANKGVKKEPPSITNYVAGGIGGGLALVAGISFTSDMLMPQMPVPMNRNIVNQGQGVPRAYGNMVPQQQQAISASLKQ